MTFIGVGVSSMFAQKGRHGGLPLHRQQIFNKMNNLAKNTFHIGAKALENLATSVGEEFETAVSLILNTKGKIIVVGLGKSGLLGTKIAATFSSTGTPSSFMHATEAYHGDIGMVTRIDSVILISYSGETDEVIRLIPILEERGVKIISIVGEKNSTLARHSNSALIVKVEREACPHNLAPTTSCLTTIAMGDALAIALMEKRKFKEEDFARNHPGGSLGKRLLTKVKNVMKKQLPMVSENSDIREVILTMTEGRMGIAIVTENNKLKGVVTDGDLRRMLLKVGSIDNINASDIMTKNPLTINENINLYDAEEIMLEKKITVLIATDDNGDISGLLQIYG